MKLFGWFLCAAFSMFLAGCAPSVSLQQAQEIAKDSGVLLGHEVGDIPASKWPASVSSLKPLEVSRRPEGVYISTSKFHVEEHGVFILDPQSSFSPAKNGDPSYKPITAGIYTYHIAG
ncbi:hypothetical protein [Luteimonas panaciterrae]|uniref:hypothetical protein n=1 Tax=Luteimonas panaciterrae TaxID=363885 RepID=UPI001CFB1643|nr:hypothetical protein [Luteimonas panaciterrae]